MKRKHIVIGVGVLLGALLLIIAINYFSVPPQTYENQAVDITNNLSNPVESDKAEDFSGKQNLDKITVDDLSGASGEDEREKIFRVFINSRTAKSSRERVTAYAKFHNWIRKNRNEYTFIKSEIESYLSSSEATDQAKIRLYYSLAGIGLPEALQTIRETVAYNPDIQFEIADGISKFNSDNDNLWLKENADILIAFWGDDNIPIMTNAIGTAITSLGTNAGVDFLTKEALSQGNKNKIAEHILLTNINYESVDYFSNQLSNSSSSRERQILSGQVLANAGNEMAVKSIFKWTNKATSITNEELLPLYKSILKRRGASDMVGKHIVHGGVKNVQLRSEIIKLLPQEDQEYLYSKGFY